MTTLNARTLAQLGPGVSWPRYDRRHVTTGIVHIGVGNFHRSHQAMYLDALMNRGVAMDWGICGVGLQPSNARMRDAMAAQDGLYTLVIRHGDGTWDARVIGSMVEYLFAPDDPEAVIEKLAAPATRLVTLTVTEGGYNLDAVTGEFREQLAANRPFTRSAAVVASWARYAEGTDENGEPYEIDDALAPRLQAAGRRQRRDPAAFLEGNRAVFGELADDPRFTRVYSSILASLLDRGVRKTFAGLDRHATVGLASEQPARRQGESP